MKRITILAVWIAVLLLFAGCRASEEPSVSRTSFMLDTMINITLYDWTDEETLTMTMQEIDRLEALLSVEREGSDLYRLAQSAGKEWVEISPECQEVLTLAKDYWRLSEGHFDITTGPLIDLWSIRDGKGHYPTEAELKATLPRISSEKLQIGDGCAYLEEVGMKANLGAIAKGYIADQVKELLMKNGVKHAAIDLGRNLIFIGEKSDKSPFRIGVQSPFEERGELATILLISGKSVVTSGINERYFEYEGVKYHHILDPFTGFPADAGVASVTIISNQSVDGDALSTTSLLLGVEKGLALIEQIPEVEALFIQKDGQQVMSSGFAAYLADQAQ